MKMDVLRFEPRLSIVIRRRTALPDSNARENEAHAAQMAAEPITSGVIRLLLAAFTYTCIRDTFVALALVLVGLWDCGIGIGCPMPTWA
jgi:hypothetical protein